MYQNAKTTAAKLLIMFLCVMCGNRTHDPDTRILYLLQWRGVPRGMERRQDPPAQSPTHPPPLTTFHEQHKCCYNVIKTDAQTGEEPNNNMIMLVIIIYIICSNICGVLDLCPIQNNRHLFWHLTSTGTFLDSRHCTVVQWYRYHQF